MRPFKALAIIGFAALLAVAAIAVAPETVPNLVAGVRERPESPALVTGCWAAATTASIAGKRALSDGALTWRGAATAHIVGTVSNRVVPAGVGAGGTYLIALRRGGMTLTTAAAMAVLWAFASGIAHSSGALIGLVWLYSGIVGIGALAVVGVLTGWRVRAHRVRAQRTPRSRHVTEHEGGSASLSGDWRYGDHRLDHPAAVTDAPMAGDSEPHRLRTAAESAPVPDTRRGRVVQKLHHLRSSIADAVAVVRANPRCAGAALLAQAGAMSCLAVGFAIATSSLGVPVPMATAMAAYMAGTAVSATVPTPAGIGAADAALVGALVMVGSPLGDAIPAVLIFRAVILLAPIVVAAVMALRWTTRLWPRGDGAPVVSES